MSLSADTLRPALLLTLLAAGLCSADELSEVTPPPSLLPLDMHIVDEQAMQVDGKKIVRNLGSNLNLTCRLNWTGLAQTPHVPPQISWYIPTSPNRDRIRKEQLESGLRLSVNDLRSHDSGNFSCEAQVDHQLMLKSFILYVRPPGCSDGQFQCQGRCIGRVYVCDGKPDCADGLDEMLDTCGKHVTCDDDGRSGGGQLLRCGDRCRPRHYCCFQGNCSTGRFINEDEQCCKRVIRRLSAGQYRPHEHDSARPRHDDPSGAYDRTYLETAIYTIIGCAVAFILIVSIMIVAFCRVHLRQSARLSSYSHMRAARAAAAHPPLADFDHLMMSGSHFPAYYGGGPGHMMVTYNINNGVQVMPLISPPSYSEAVQGQAGGPLETHRAPAAAAAAQPNAGPPPPYASRETLAEPAPAYNGTENNNGDINGNSVAEAAEAPPPPAPAPAPAPAPSAADKL